MLGNAKEDYVMLSSDMNGIIGFIERGELRADSAVNSISKVLVLSDIGTSAQVTSDDDEYSVVDFLGRLDAMREQYGFDCLESSIKSFERVILRLSMQDAGKLTLFQVLAIYYMSTIQKYGYTRGELSQLPTVVSDNQRFEMEFSDVLRALNYCMHAHGSEGLICKTLKVTNSRGAIGAVGDYLNRRGVVEREEVFAVKDQELTALHGQIDALSVQLQDKEAALSRIEREVDNYKNTITEKDAQIKRQADQAREKMYELESDKKNLNEEIAKLQVRLSTPMGTDSITGYTTVTTQSVSACTVSKVLYFKEISPVYTLKTLLTAFMRKLSDQHISFKMLIFDNAPYLEEKYGKDIPIVDFKTYSNDKTRYMQNPILILRSTIVAPVEDYLQTDTNILIVYDCLGARNDIVSGGIVSRFFVANTAHDVERARSLFGATSASEIISFSGSTAMQSVPGIYGLAPNPRVRAGARTRPIITATAQLIQSPMTIGGSTNSGNFVKMLSDMCGFQLA